MFTGVQKRAPLKRLLKSRKNKTAPLPLKVEVKGTLFHEENETKIRNFVELKRSESFVHTKRPRGSPIMSFRNSNNHDNNLRRPKTAPGSTMNFERPSLHSAVIKLPGQF